MSIQEVKSDLHQLIDSVDNALVLEQLLNSAKRLLADQPANAATLTDLTDVQREQLDQAIQDHQEGKTVSHQEMNYRHREWLNK